MTVKFTDVYDGEEHARVEEIDVTAPQLVGEELDGDLIEDWADEEIRPHTGDGNAIDKNAGYFAEIMSCDEYPSLVGREFEWM